LSLSVENIVLVASVLLLVSIMANKTSGRLGVPSLVLFLAIGMLAGSDGIGKIQFNDPLLAQSLGIIALTFILFAGGLETKWESVRPVLWHGVSLSTFGVLFTAAAVGLFVWRITDFTLVESLLIGSIASSTDAAAVFSILRSKNIGLKGNLRPTLELESGSNDPMAYFLTIGLTGIIMNEDKSMLSLIPLFFIQMAIGVAAGFVMGKAMVWVTNKINLDYEGLYPVLVMAMALLTFGLTDSLGGNGFLAIYLSAIILGNSNFIHKKSIIRFYDGQAWLMQIIMFLTLGLLVNPGQMIPHIGIGLVIALFLMLVARPAAVFLSLSPFRLNLRERLLISWVGLRGAVPIVFATYPLLAGVNKSDIIFNIVFFIVLTSVLIQGTSIPWVARRLYLYRAERPRKRYPLELELSDSFHNELFEIEVPLNSPAVGKPIVGLGFPRASLIVLVSRKDRYITPNGNTVIEAGDKLMIMADNKSDSDKVRAIFGISP
jgi:cell volume regulation protein A